MSAHDNAYIISQALQANWSLSSPAKTDIFWATTRVDSATFLAAGKNYAIGCYNPSSPTQVSPLCREVWEQIERVMVDIFVKVLTTPAAATDVRKSIKDELYKTLHTQEFQIGPRDVYVERESNKVEGPDLVRLTLQVACKNYDIQT